MSQSKTGQITEDRVRSKLQKFGMIVKKPVPDRGIDIVAWFPDRPSKIVKIQVKGRNPQCITSYRWFQIRVSKKQLETAKDRGDGPEIAWLEKVVKNDFLILDAVGVDETWVFSREQALELIVMNEVKYCTRPDNIFTYDEPLKPKQKEMNLDIVVSGQPLTKYFRHCLNNFRPVIEFLNKGRSKLS